MFRFLRRLLGRETVTDVADEFPNELKCVSLILYRWFKVEFLKSPIDPKVARVFAAQVVKYLIGEDLESASEAVTPETQALIDVIKDDIPETAANLMRQDVGLREIIVYTLRMRLVLSGYFNQAEMPTESERGKRFGALLQTYGGEFQQELTVGSYHALVNNLITWAESPQFPGNWTKNPSQRKP